MITLILVGVLVGFVIGYTDRITVKLIAIGLLIGVFSYSIINKTKVGFTPSIQELLKIEIQYPSNIIKEYASV